MKQKILFVDDQPLILQGLQRMLRRERSDWDMVFVSDGKTALEEMRKTQFDVIVSDMRMPGMNGPELLLKVMEEHPEVVRIVLSGEAEQNMIFESIGSIHQYLSKPCSPEDLKRAIGRSSSLSRLFLDGSLKKVLGSMSQLPVIPTVYLELTKKLDTLDVEIEELGRIVSKDVGMTANLLKLVNSAFFTSSATIVTPTEVISHLGIEMTQALVLALDVFNKYDPSALGLFSLSRLWRHSMKVGQIAKAIAARETDNQNTLDECFIAGLLHDVGKILLAVNFPGKYDRVIQLQKERNIPVTVAEQEVFGACHATVGGYLLGLWGLPVAVVEAISDHHFPKYGEGDAFSPLTAVHVANAFCSSDDNSLNVQSANEIDEDYLKALGLNERLDVWKRELKVIH